jgi:hypothetical protein
LPWGRHVGGIVLHDEAFRRFPERADVGQFKRLLSSTLLLSLWPWNTGTRTVVAGRGGSEGREFFWIFNHLCSSLCSRFQGTVDMRQAVARDGVRELLRRNALEAVLSRLPFMTRAGNA